MSLVADSTLLNDYLPAPDRKKILLLEDDEEFGAIVADFLDASSFDVTAVRNGVDGMREVGANDFEAIICDMIMPTLPGDKFYLAIERLRPDLCKRFIFISGYRGNPQTDDFLRDVNGAMLCKPFSVDDLLDLIGFVQLRVTLKAK